MTRDEYLAEVDAALRPVKELLQMVRMGVETTFNPVMTQVAIEYAKVITLAALAASGTAVPGEVLELALAAPAAQQPTIPDPPPAKPAGLDPPPRAEP